MLSRRALLLAPAAFFAHRAYAAATTIEQRSLRGFDRVRWTTGGELQIEQTGREHVSVEAEAWLHQHIVTEVNDGQLTIKFKPGRYDIRERLLFRLEVIALRRLDAQGSGDMRIGPLASSTGFSLMLAGSGDAHLARLEASALEIDIAGSGNVDIAAGRVDRQRVVISGSGTYQAFGLESRQADAAIEGSGDVQLAVAERLNARIDGSGDVRYRGSPAVTRAVRGSGSVERE